MAAEGGAHKRFAGSNIHVNMRATLSELSAT